ncbi:phosphate ABC transporter substrate-binding protein [Oxalobacter sp. OttesenSCG-928-P03]|nr:phosphate ABC transporter substrate-binding protein [Oxalobacter sp. OttesenSCG-928-P03]
MKRFRTWGRCFLSFALGTALIAASASASELDAFKGMRGQIDIAGGTAHIPVMKDAARKIMQANPDIRISIAAGGSGVGVQKAGEGLVQIGNTGRALSADEVAKYGLKSWPFALDGVAVALHPANGIDSLTSRQVCDIFSGKITNWKALGGRDAAIHLYTRDEASGTREVFREKLLKKGPIADTANVVTSNGAMKTVLAGDPDGIGYVSIGHIDRTIKAPKLDQVAPTQDNALSGKYPVVRKLYMNTKGEPDALTAAFINYVRGPEGEPMIKAAGYLPIR